MNDDPPLARENIMTARILIIEDEEPLTLLLRYNLEAEGYAVDSAVRGDDADLKLKENTPDLAVIDWMLPGLSGIELIRRLRARPETQALPIIMLTARGEETERVRGLATGADDYIVKPFSVPELLARIRALLRRTKPERVAGSWNLPSAVINYAEDPGHAALRILREQVGATPTALKLIDVQSFGDKHWDICFVFSAEIPSVGKLGSDIDKAEWFELAKLPPELREGHKEVLDYAKSRKVI